MLTIGLRGAGVGPPMLAVALALTAELTWLLCGSPFQHHALNYVKALMNAQALLVTVVGLLDVVRLFIYKTEDSSIGNEDSSMILLLKNDDWGSPRCCRRSLATSPRHNAISPRTTAASQTSRHRSWATLACRSGPSRLPVSACILFRITRQDGGSTVRSR